MSMPLAVLALAICGQAHAQQTAKVVSSCGTASYTAGGVNYVTVDTAGNACGASGAAPSGTQDVNIKNVNGAPPSLTNPVFVANAETADVTGTFTNGTQTTSVTNSTADGYAAGLISINGTYATASGVFEASDDSGTTWYAVNCSRSDGSASETGYTTLTNTNRQWSCPVGGNDSLRVRSTAVATGTVNVRVGVSAPPPSTDSVSGTVTSVPVANTPVAGSTATVVTGGTAVTLVTGPIKGGYIVNPINLAAQGVAAAENAYIDPVGAPGSTDTAGNGTTAILTPGQTYALPALATGVVVKGNAATSGHKLTVVVW